MAKHSRLKQVAERQKQAVQQKSGESTVLLKPYERTIFGLRAENEAGEEVPHVNLKYFACEYQCFSEWEKGELAGFTELLRKLSQMTWPQILASGGSLGSKTGLGCTKHNDISKLPPHPKLKTISEDITFFELRATVRARVHGFRVRDAFFLVWLDREHVIYPS